MVYFQVPEKFSGKQVYTSKKNHYTLVGTELITEKECEKIGIINFARKNFTLTNVSRRKIYWCFGARFKSKIHN